MTLEPTKQRTTRLGNENWFYEKKKNDLENNCTVESWNTTLCLVHSAVRQIIFSPVSKEPYVQSNTGLHKN